MSDIRKPLSRGRYNVFNIFVGVCLAVFASAVALLYFWMFDSRVPVEVRAGYPIKPAFVLGEPIVIEERLVIHRRCPGNVSRTIVDGANIAYPVLLPSDPLLGAVSERLRIEFRMPQHLGPGRYRYRAEAIWQCNPMRSIRQAVVDVPFVVVEADPTEQRLSSPPASGPDTSRAP